MADSIYWSKLPGLSSRIKWPVEVIDMDTGDGKGTVYCKSDNAYFTVKLEQLETFPGQFEKMKNKCLAALNKRTDTKQAFLDDIEWALQVCDSVDDKSTKVKRNVSAPVSGQDCTTSTTAENNQSSSTSQICDSVDDKSTKVKRNVSAPISGQDCTTSTTAENNQSSSTSQICDSVDDKSTKVKRNVSAPISGQDCTTSTTAENNQSSSTSQICDSVDDKSTKVKRNVSAPISGQDCTTSTTAENNQSSSTSQICDSVDDKSTKVKRNVSAPISGQDCTTSTTAENNQSSSTSQICDSVDDKSTKVKRNVSAPISGQDCTTSTTAENNQSSSTSQICDSVDDKSTKVKRNVSAPISGQDCTTSTTAENNQSSSTSQICDSVDDKSTKVKRNVSAPISGQDCTTSTTAENNQSSSTSQICDSVDDKSTKVKRNVSAPISGQDCTTSTTAENNQSSFTSGQDILCSLIEGQTMADRTVNVTNLKSNPLKSQKIPPGSTSDQDIACSAVENQSVANGAMNVQNIRSSSRKSLKMPSSSASDQDILCSPVEDHTVDDGAINVQNITSSSCKSLKMPSSSASDQDILCSPVEDHTVANGAINVQNITSSSRKSLKMPSSSASDQDILCSPVEDHTVDDGAINVQNITSSSCKSLKMPSSSISDQDISCSPVKDHAVDDGAINVQNFNSCSLESQKIPSAFFSDQDISCSPVEGQLVADGPIYVLIGNSSSLESQKMPSSATSDQDISCSLVDGQTVADRTVTFQNGKPSPLKSQNLMPSSSTSDQDISCSLIEGQIMADETTNVTNSKSSPLKSQIMPSTLHSSQDTSCTLCSFTTSQDLSCSPIISRNIACRKVNLQTISSPYQSQNITSRLTAGQDISCSSQDVQLPGGTIAYSRTTDQDISCSLSRGTTGLGIASSSISCQGCTSGPVHQDIISSSIETQDLVVNVVKGGDIASEMVIVHQNPCSSFPGQNMTFRTINYEDITSNQNINQEMKSSASGSIIFEQNGTYQILDSIVYSSDPEEDIEEEIGDTNMVNIVDELYQKTVQLEKGETSSNESDETQDVPKDKDSENIDGEGDIIENNSDIEEEMSAVEVLADKRNPKIYINKVVKSSVVKTKQKKKHDRVYNSQHACYFCGRLVQHIREHLKKKHRKEDEVCAALNDQSGVQMSLLRSKGDDKHNCRVIREGNGCLLIFRRPTKEFVSELYGPCVHCREWMLKTTLQRHQGNCAAKNLSSSRLTKRNLILQSDILSGRLKTKASSLLQQEVFSFMTRDCISEIAQSDFLLVALGESWLRRNIDNKLKRRYYASQRMRLNARLLIELRKGEEQPESSEQEQPEGNEKEQPEGNEKEVIAGKSLWDFIAPEHFDAIARAAIQVAMPMMDDEEDLKAPSNAIKLKYDLIRLVNAKWCFALKEGEGSNKAVIGQCQGFLKLIEAEWPEKVTKLARMVLAQRQRDIKKELPSPDDIKHLNEYISGELKTVPLRKELQDFQKAARLAQAKLMMYNKRRSGEIDGISVRNYASRCHELSDLDQSLVGELNELEKHLLSSQELMLVRGKRGRQVPCIIPADVKPVLSFISNQEVRDAVGIKKRNRFLFPSTGDGALRSYESLKWSCNDLNLKNPERITSVMLRKYTATLTQVINLQPNELQWVCNHLGHTKRVHLQHYQQMSGFIERVHISKLLLIQDLNLTEKFAGKRLESVQFEDIVTSATNCEQESAMETERDSAAETKQNSANEAEQGSAMEAGENERNFDKMSSEDDELMMDYEPPKKKRKQQKKQMWSKVEQEEVRKYFASYLDAKTTPRYAACEKAKKLSRKHGGELHKRANHLIVKKISAWNHK